MTEAEVCSSSAIERRATISASSGDMLPTADRVYSLKQAEMGARLTSAFAYDGARLLVGDTVVGYFVEVSRRGGASPGGFAVGMGSCRASIDDESLNARGMTKERHGSSGAVVDVGRRPNGDASAVGRWLEECGPVIELGPVNATRLTTAYPHEQALMFVAAVHMAQDLGWAPSASGTRRI